jgi:hypothetical protein
MMCKVCSEALIYDAVILPSLGCDILDGEELPTLHPPMRRADRRISEIESKI